MPTLEGTEIVEAGRRLGFDFYRLSLQPRQATWPSAVQEGFDAAAANRQRRHTADRFQRKWLQLRLGAWTRGRAVADDVSVKLLQRLDVTHCPVTRQALTHGERTGSDWSIDRLNNDGAYAASNLAVLSVLANQAKGDLGFDAVLALSSCQQSARGLAPIEWLRLAVLMMGPAFTSRQHLAPVLPLCASLPACSVRLAMQQIQRLFTLHAGRPSGKNWLVREFRLASSSDRAEMRLRFLADAVHDGLKRVSSPMACWDVWLEPAVLQALVCWRESLDDRGWATAAVISGHLAGGRRVTATSLQPWHLPTRGYLPGGSASSAPAG